MNNKQYWNTFYEKKLKVKESLFARFIHPYLRKGEVIDLGCGNGRDLNYFLKCGLKAKGVDESFEGPHIKKQDVVSYMKSTPSPAHVYTRFVWHAIKRNEQLAILKWVKNYLYIEARTTEDSTKNKVFPIHNRNYVSVPTLVKDLKEHGFQITFLEEGTGLAPYKSEDPHIVRIVAHK